MAIPDLIACLGRLGYPLPARAFQCTVDSEDDPTRISFDLTTSQAHTFERTPRHYLTDEEKDIVKRAIILHRAGRRLSGAYTP